MVRMTFFRDICVHCEAQLYEDINRKRNETCCNRFVYRCVGNIDFYSCTIREMTPLSYNR